jgi:hypothetical protein
LDSDIHLYGDGKILDIAAQEEIIRAIKNKQGRFMRAQIIATFASAVVLLSLAACAPEAKKSPFNEQDLRAGDVQRMILSVPKPLVVPESPQAEVNLDDPKSVADALGVKLTGDSQQLLYTIALTAPSSDEGVVYREIPIRVDNIADGSQMIRSWQSSSL